MTKNTEDDSGANSGGKRTSRSASIKVILLRKHGLWQLIAELKRNPIRPQEAKLVSIGRLALTSYAESPVLQTSSHISRLLSKQKRLKKAYYSPVKYSEQNIWVFLTVQWPELDTLQQIHVDLHKCGYARIEKFIMVIRGCSNKWQH
jgi:hypothetical protein